MINQMDTNENNRMDGSQLSKAQKRKRKQIRALKDVSSRYTQLVRLASVAHTPLAFSDPEVIAVLASSSPALQAALEARWGTEKYEQFVTTGANVEPISEDIKLVDNDDMGLFLVATMREELLDLAVNNFAATGGENGGRLCDRYDADTALALLTLCKLDSVAEEKVRELDNSDPDRVFADLKDTVKSGKGNFLAPSQQVVKIAGVVDFKKTSLEEITALYDVTYVIDAQNVINSSPTLRSRAWDWLKRHKNINSVVKVTPSSAATLTTAVALTGVAKALDTTSETTIAVGLTAVITGALYNSVNYYRKGQVASKTVIEQADQVAGVSAFKRSVDKSRRIQLVCAKNSPDSVHTF